MAETGRKEKIMGKIEFKDNTELMILEGASLSRVTAVVDTFAELQTVADVLTKEGNLDSVKFKKNNTVFGTYEHLALVEPLFHVHVENEKVYATFSLREKTDIEKEISAIKKGQQVQDLGIMELAGMIGGE